ncbi:hypothetical protein K501DRAFT_284327, partial [Backusella circina FSU 941]
MDPSALKWHDWAQLHGSKKENVVRSPPQSTSSSTSTLTMAKSQPRPSSSSSSPKPHHQDVFISEKNMCAKPTREELREMMPDPIHCFCNEQAHVLELEQVGPVLVCYRWANQQDPVMCGFHMHQDAWLQFRHELEAGLPLSIYHSSLKTCKHFNFSFCTYFFVYNNFPVLLDNAPTCFCNKPLIDHHYRTSTGCFDLQLRCEKMYTNQNRCNFQISARNVLFLKSSCHPIVIEKKTDERLKSEAHSQNLLSALLASTETQQEWEGDNNRFDAWSSGESSLSPKSQTPSPILSHRSPFQNTGVLKKRTTNGHHHQSTPVTTPVTTPPPTITSTITSTITTETKGSSSSSSPHILPQPLELYELQQIELEREQKQKQKEQEEPLSTLPPSPPLCATLLLSPTIPPQQQEHDWGTEKQQLKVEIDRLQQEIDLKTRDSECIAPTVSQHKLQQEIDRHENEYRQNRRHIEQCDLNRVTQQSRLTRLEWQLANSKEREDEENFEKARPKGEDFKC